MEKKTSKKFIIAIVALAMVLCLAVGGLIGVLAAPNQEVKSTFNVQYTIGSNIAGQVSATYKIGNGAAKNMKTDVEENEETDFKESEVIAFDTLTDAHADLTAYKLQTQEENNTITLDTSNLSVVFAYSITNLATQGMKVVFTDGCVKDAQSVTVEYKAYKVTDDGNEEMTGEEMTKTVAAGAASEVEFVIAGSSTAILEITVTISNTGDDGAHYNATASDGHAFALSSTVTE